MNKTQFQTFKPGSRMSVLFLVLHQPMNRWLNIIVAAVLFNFNLIGLPTYSSAYGKFLIIVGITFNVLPVS